MSPLDLLDPRPDPTTAVIAVTLNCGARCVMCDIWQNRIEDELRPEELAGLPPTLRDINITGGEPFQRPDLPEIVEVLEETCPRARIVISTNGFQPRKTERDLERILEIDSEIGLRVSVDAMGQTHDEIRGVPGGFERCLEVLTAAERLGVRDLGIGVTLMERNLGELRSLYRLTRERDLELSVTVATGSDIYFGPGQERHRGKMEERLAGELEWLARREYRHPHPKRWIRGWFDRRLARYVVEGRRPFPCRAGRGFFYLDSRGTVYACHLRDLRMGNLRREPWEEIWEGPDASAAREASLGCHQCWMVCTSKSSIRRRAVRVGGEVLREKLASHLPALRETGLRKPDGGEGT